MWVRVGRLSAWSAAGRALPLVGLLSCHHEPPPVVVPSADRCVFDRRAAPEQGGAGPPVIALVVGVSRYRSPEIKDLRAAALDAEGMARALQDLGVPRANICLLTDQEASLTNLRRGFTEFLGQAQPGEEAIFFFAGHGSTAYDLEHEEADGWDSTLVLYDSRVDGEPELSDDELSRLLSALQQRTRTITLLLDACHSGTTARLMGRARGAPPSSTAQDPDQPSRAASRGPTAAAAIGPARLVPGVASLSAAKDGTLALEPRAGGHGYFTAGLLEALRRHASDGASWQTIFEDAVASVSAKAPSQEPFAQGDLTRVALRPDQLPPAQPAAQPSHGSDAPIITLEPAAPLPSPPPSGPLYKKCPDDTWVLRRCTTWQIKVTNMASEPLIFKGAILDGDAPPLPLPADDLAQEVMPDSEERLAPEALRVGHRVGSSGRVVVVGARGRAPPRLDSAQAVASPTASLTYVVAAEPDAYICGAEVQPAPEEVECCPP